MIDLAAKREENKRRLLGLDGKQISPYTKSDVVSEPEVCWDIISLAIRKKTIEAESKNGKNYKRQVNERMYPELLDEQTVGERAVRSRSNLKTMEEMYQIRNAMNKHYADDIDEAYIDYFKSVVEVLDGYALQVVSDMVEADAELLNKVNKIRGCE